MNSDISINVIIPVYNTEKYIDKCLTSLLNQTFTDWHATIVNDGSNDDSEQICQKFIENYPDKFSMFRTKHKGPGYARNFGIEHCEKEAKYIYFFDSDDYLEPTAFEKLFYTAEVNGADIGICGYVMHKGKLSETFKFDSGEISKKKVFNSILNNDVIGTYVWNKLFRASVFTDLRFYEDGFYEDVVTTYKAVLNSKKIVVISDVLYNYVRHSGSVVTASTVSSLKDLYSAISKRNSAIIVEYPELKEKALINSLRINIFIWNQVCKQQLILKHPEFLSILDLIKKEKNLYTKLDSRHFVMAYLIKYCPKTYSRVLYLVEKTSKYLQNGR